VTDQGSDPFEEVGPPPDPDPEPPPPPVDWRRDKQGKQYVAAVGRKGIIYRRGEETIAEALERDKRPKDERPPKDRKRRGAGAMPDKPRDIDLQAVELALVEALRSPAILAAGFGDAWLANHFTIQAPILARNLVVASEHNSWLRRQLETMAEGGTGAMAIITLLGLGGAFLAYAAPPVIHLFNLPAPEMARQLFAMPPRREREDATTNGTAPFQAAAA
jgi:hypothetical protein